MKIGFRCIAWLILLLKDWYQQRKKQSTLMKQIHDNTVLIGLKQKR